MITFEGHFDKALREARLAPRKLEEGECQTIDARRCSLCHAGALTYQDELRIKETALRYFWKTNFKSPEISPLVQSPFGRNYRATTKRKAFRWDDSMQLGLINPNAPGPMRVVQCMIEPADHAPIYARIQESIQKTYAHDLAQSLNYVVIKGNYTEFTVLFNVQEMSGPVVKAANTLSKTLTKFFDKIIAVFLYEDKSDGRYYLGSSGSSRHKRLFGKDQIYQKVLGKSFLYSPVGFSQVNQSLLETLLTRGKELLVPNKNSRLFDLYCGYGLFGLSYASEFRAVTGAEISSHSVEAAKANAKRHHANNVRFHQSDISETTLRRIFADVRPEDHVILDPNRNGTAENVIEYIAATRVSRVMHIFCNIDIVPAEIRRWTASKYKLIHAVPFDLFPGTPAIELMTILEPI